MGDGNGVGAAGSEYEPAAVHLLYSVVALLLNILCAFC